MGLQSALSTALTGLNGAETIIDVAGNNIANSQTVGFKESGVNFATQFLQTISIGSAPSNGNGGTNPRQIGLGVKVAEITQDFTQGTIEISSNPLDVAIQGDGFLIVQGGQGERLFTRNGQLKTNQNNEVVTISGNRVLGWNAVDGIIVQDLVPLVIPIGGSVVNKVTENVSFNGTLSPSSDVGVGNIIESGVLSRADIEVPNETGFTSASLTATPPINVSGMVGGGSAGAGTNLTAGTYQYRVTFVDGAGNETAGSSSIPVTLGTADDVDLTGIPQADGSNYVSRRIYRTAADSSGPFYLAGTIADATTQTFTDTTDNTALLTNAPLDTAELAVDSVYSYYVTYYNASTQIETRPTSLKGPVSINSTNQRIRIEDIPIPTDAGFTEKRIYRSLGDDASTHYFVEAIPVAQTVYMDSTADSAIEINAEVNLEGPEINADTLLTDIIQRSGTDYVPLFSGGGTLSFTAKKGDITLPTKEFTIIDGPNGSRVLDYMNFIQESLGINTDVPSAPTIQVLDGRITIQANKGEKNAIQIGPSSFVFTPTTTGQNETKNLVFEETQEAAGQGSSTEFVVYDSLGVPLTVQLTTVIEEKNDSTTVWRWFATSGDNEPLTGDSTVVGTGLITYDDNGDYVLNNDNVTVVIERNATASQSPLDFDLDFTRSNGKEQQQTEINFISQDGFPPGVLTDFTITESGEIRGVYSNGVGQTLGQIRMAQFINNTGLQQVGNNLYATGVNSGEPQYGDPGDAGLGSLTAGAVELSNTDIGQNLIELILASTQYRGGARVITAVQELLDELLALRR
ncbi:MAG: flagellar hook-basal body complex protein [Bythopirellula sp.]|nr:flagellar hook-basal body complex protein [Bythopirellula sp.]